MILRFNKDLSSQEIYANGIELAQKMGMDTDEKGERAYEWPEEMKQLLVTFQNPVLVTDYYRMGMLDPVTRDTLFSLLESSARITEYDGTSIRFDQKKYERLWGPSIDTLLFCRALDKIDFGGLKAAIEEGAGSGFVSLYTLNKSPELESITLIDLNRTAMDCWIDNVKDKRAKFFIGDALNFIEGKRFDLILCNPPYIARPRSIDDNAYEGVGLLVHSIETASKHLNPGGMLITNISSLCSDIAIPAIKRSNVSAEKLDEMTVPLKVYNVLHNKEWMEFLLERGLKYDFHDGYKYWHTISIYKITPQE